VSLALAAFFALRLASLANWFVRKRDRRCAQGTPRLSFSGTARSLGDYEIPGDDYGSPP